MAPAHALVAPEHALVAPEHALAVVCRQRRHTGFAWSLGSTIFAWSLGGTIFFLHRRALQIQANGLGKSNYMGLFLYGCELGHEG